MQILRSSECTPFATDFVCRETRLWSLITGPIVAGLFFVPVVLIWQSKVLWFGAFLVGPLAILIALAILGDLRARFRQSNWILAARPRGLWIQFRTYQDQGPLDTPGVIALEDTEIASVSRYVETRSIPSNEGKTRTWKVYSLDIRLTHRETAELEAAFKEYRQRKQPARRLGWMRMVSRLTSFPVSLPEPDLIRIAWRGDNSWIVPSLPRTLDRLAEQVQVSAESRYDSPAWQTLSAAELDDELLRLIQGGQRMEAIRLLVQCRGYSLTKAHQFVEELGSRA